MAEETILREKNDSIVVKRNFKGEYGFEIHLKFDNSTDDIDEVITDIDYIDTRLRNRFILPSGV